MEEHFVNRGPFKLCQTSSKRKKNQLVLKLTWCDIVGIRRSCSIDLRRSCEITLICCPRVCKYDSGTPVTLKIISSSWNWYKKIVVTLWTSPFPCNWWYTLAYPKALGEDKHLWDSKLQGACEFEGLHFGDQWWCCGGRPPFVPLIKFFLINTIT